VNSLCIWPDKRAEMKFVGRFEYFRPLIRVLLIGPNDPNPVVSELGVGARGLVLGHVTRYAIV
jgi:hypothetical protein